MVLEGPSAISAARQVIGATNPLEAAPGSIRGDFAIATGENLVHGSDSPDRRRARSRSSSPICEGGGSRRAATRPRLALAAAPGDPRVPGGPVRGSASAFAELERGRGHRGGADNALGKARAVTRGRGEMVLGVDTVVALDGRLYGKPAMRAGARDAATRSRGATHSW